MNTTQTVTLSYDALMHYIEQLTDSVEQERYYRHAVMVDDTTSMTAQIQDDVSYLKILKAERDSLEAMNTDLCTPDVLTFDVGSYTTDSITYNIDVTRKPGANDFYVTVHQAEATSMLDCLSKGEAGSVVYTPRQFVPVDSANTLDVLNLLAKQACIQ